MWRRWSALMGLTACCALASSVAMSPTSASANAWARQARSEHCSGLAFHGYHVGRFSADRILACGAHRRIIRGWIRHDFSGRGVYGSYGGRARGYWFCGFDDQAQVRASCSAGKEGFINFRVV